MGCTDDDGNECGSGGIASAIGAGIENAKIEDRETSVSAPYEGEAIPLFLVPDGMSLEIPTDALKLSRQLALKPARVRGVANHQEIGSFIDHLNRFKAVDASVVWADVDKVQLTGVLNYAPNREEPAWGDHRSTYTCPLAREWKLWTLKNNQAMGQDDFAEFLEANATDLASPDADEGFPAPARLMEIARTLRIHAKSTFERSTNPTTGEASLLAKTEHDAATSTKIPASFLIGIPVFEAGAKYRIEARLRMALKDGRPTFGYLLVNPETVKRDAFDEVRDRVAAETKLPVYAGVPEEFGG